MPPHFTFMYPPVFVLVLCLLDVAGSPFRSVPFRIGPFRSVLLRSVPFNAHAARASTTARMAMETVLVFARETGRTLVMPPAQKFYLLSRPAVEFADMFPIEDLDPYMDVISMEVGREVQY